MNKKLILVASPPACGKTFVSELLAKELGHTVYLDKDDLCDLLRTAFILSGNDINMDGGFYAENLRPAEYSTIFNIAFSALRFEDYVILNAPFGKEVRSTESMRALKKRANSMGADLILVWVSTPVEICYERMKKRNSDRDILKLQNFDEYVSKTDFSAPKELLADGAVDRLIIFDTKDDSTLDLSLKNTIKIITGE